MYWSEEIYSIYEIDQKENTANYQLFLDLIYDEDRELVERSYRESVASGEEYNIRYRIKAGDSHKWIEARGITYYDKAGQAERTIGSTEDISEMLIAQQKIEHMAYHDDLTGLANRKLFADKLDAALSRAQENRTNLVVLFLDLDNFDATREILSRCEALGVRFSLDDFGTGYSSLTYFHALPISKLKIDQSFIKNINTKNESLLLVKSILAIAKTNITPVVAE